MIPLPIYGAEIETIYASTIGIGLRTLAITAPRIGAGVSTISYTLARRSAASGLRTLLLDANSTRTAVPAGLGIAQQNWQFQDGSYQNAITTFDDIGFAVLPAPQDTPIGLRDSRLLREHLSRLDFDIVVIDTPPVLQHTAQDVPGDQIAAACDGAVLVVMQDDTIGEDVKTAMGRLKQHGVNVVGSVMNQRQ